MTARRRSRTTINDKLVLILPDIHYRHQNKLALECALKAQEYLRPGRTLQLGDALDGEIFSSHPGVRLDESHGYDFLRDEVEPCRRDTDRCLKNTRRYIQMGGNHEYRITRRCIEWGKLGQSIHGVVDPERLLGAGRSNTEWEWVPYVHATAPVSYYSICKTLIAVHGWSFARHAAQVHLDATRDRSVVFGHTHRQQYASTRNVFTNEVIRAFSVGCLTNLQPLYSTDSRPNSWCHGFGLVYVGSDKRRFTEYGITIDRNSCILPDGTEIRA